MLEMLPAVILQQHDLDRVGRRQPLVRIAAERPGHRQIALGYLDIGADRKLGGLSKSRGEHRRPPDNRTDEALAVGISGILLVEHHFLRGRRCRLCAGRGRGRSQGLRALGLNTIDDLRPRGGGRRRSRPGVS